MLLKAGDRASVLRAALTAVMVAVVPVPAVHAATLVPRRTPGYPYLNQTSTISASQFLPSGVSISPSHLSTAPSPTPTPPPTCDAECSVLHPLHSTLYWQSFPINTTIIAGTIVLSFDPSTNTTKTSTVFNALPSGISLPDTNAGGTRVASITGFDYLARTNFTTVVAYPTSYVDYPYSYYWSGVLPTATNGSSICATATTKVTELFPSHPRPPPRTFTFEREGDRFGTNYFPVWVPGSGPQYFYQSAFPGLAAYQYCTPYPLVLAAQVWETASFLWETSRTTGSGGGAGEQTEDGGNEQTTASPPPPPPSPAEPTTVSPGPTTNDAGPIAQVQPTANPPSPTPSPDAGPSRVEDSIVPGPATSANTAGIAPSIPARPDQSPPAPSNPGDSPATTAPAVSAPDVPTPQTLNPVVGSVTQTDARPVILATPTSNPRPNDVLPSVAIGPTQLPVSTAALPTIVNGAPTTVSAVVIGPNTVTVGGTAVILDTPVVVNSLPGGETRIQVGTNVAATLPAVAQATSALPGPVVLGDQTYTPNAANQFVAGSRTLSVGGGPVTFEASAGPSATAIIELQTAANGASRIVVADAGTTYTFAPAPPPPTPAAIFTVGANTYTANANNEFVAGSVTLTVGGGPVTVSPSGPGGSAAAAVIELQTAADGATRVVSNGNAVSTLAAASVPAGSAPAQVPTPPLVLTLGANTYTANAANELVVGSQTLALSRGPVTVAYASGSPSAAVVEFRTAADGATRVISNGVPVYTVSAAASPNPPPPPVITFGGNTYTANSATEYVIAPGVTLAPGRSAQVVSGTTISLAPSPTQVVVNGVTLPLVAPLVTSPPQAAAPVLTVGGSAYTADSASRYIVDGRTLSVGGAAVTVGSGSATMLVELRTAANGATEVVVDRAGVRSTSTLPPAAATAALPTQAPPSRLTLGGQEYTAVAPGVYSLAPGVTLTPGGQATLSGTVISLAPSASFVVVGSSTQTLISASSPTLTGTLSGTNSTSSAGSTTSTSSSSSSSSSSTSAASQTSTRPNAGATVRFGGGSMALCWMCFLAAITAGIHLLS